ncbi:glycosyl hydrolase family 3 N terminal domain-containing protein [Xylaria flabelliformis]|nr:glycosyl hydrolase family 3 N terminal domain-containing protein [Xylaria flabelliformis]
MYRRAVAIGEEFSQWLSRRTRVTLTCNSHGSRADHLDRPTTGPMGRHARSGRNWEGFGPDPYLASVAMNASVTRIPSAGVQACSKRLAANEQESQRTSTTSNGRVVEAISSNVDDRTLHELYLWPFGNAVKADTSLVMCSYNRVNGHYSCANSDLSTKFLKDELAFPGYALSGWFVTHGTKNFANAGLDIEMPGNVSVLAGPSYFGDALLEAVNEGLVPEQRLEDMTKRATAPGPVLAVVQYGHQTPLLPSFPEVDARDVRRDHAQVIREIGSVGTVLLKNVDGTLHLKNINVGVFGNYAGYPTIGSVFLDIGGHPEGFEHGTLDTGGGSANVRHTNLITPLEAVRDHVKSYGGRVQIVLNNDQASIDLRFNATQAVESTAAVCPNTIVVVHGPGVVLMPGAKNENVTAILAAHYPGEQTGSSIVDVLWGAVEPSGRLPYTIPQLLSDYGPDIVESPESEASDGWQSNFSEGQAIDYRYFDFADIVLQFEIDFGLSYMTFDMSVTLEVRVVDKSMSIEPGGLIDLWSIVTNGAVEVTNIGNISGHVVPQLYVSFPQDTTPKGTPVKVLRGFSKVRLEASEARSRRNKTSAI